MNDDNISKGRLVLIGLFKLTKLSRSKLTLYRFMKLRLLKLYQKYINKICSQTLLRCLSKGFNRCGTKKQSPIKFYVRQRLNQISSSLFNLDLCLCFICHFHKRLEEINLHKYLGQVSITGVFVSMRLIMLFYQDFDNMVNKI